MLTHSDNWVHVNLCTKNSFLQKPILEKMLSSCEKNTNNDILYHYLFRALEYCYECPDPSSLDWLRKELTRLTERTFFDDDLFADFNKENIAQLISEMGQIDKKKTQHLHLFWLVSHEATLDNWSKIFPFANKPKSNVFSNIWQNDKDLPGLHLKYREKYIMNFIEFLKANSHDVSVAEQFRVLARRIKLHQAEIYNAENIIALIEEHINHQD